MYFFHITIIKSSKKKVAKGSFRTLHYDVSQNEVGVLRLYLFLNLNNYTFANSTATSFWDKQYICTNTFLPNLKQSFVSSLCTFDIQCPFNEG